MSGERATQAVLVIDVQRAVFADVHERDAVVARIGQVVARARQAKVVVIWIRQSDDELERESDGWQIVDELSPADQDVFVDKQYGDAFDATRLEAILAERGIGHLVVTGGMTDNCVRATLHGGITRGYDMTLVADGHSCVDVRDLDPTAPSPAQVIAHTNLYWANHFASHRTAAVVAAEDLSFA